MSIHIQQRDQVSRLAAAESIGTAARRIVEAVAESTTALQAVMNRPTRYPADPATALAALVQMQREQGAIEAATAEYLAWLRCAGLTRSAMARALGVRPATLTRRLAPAEHIAGARGCDLHRGENGLWTVHRIGDGLPEDHPAGEAAP